MTTLFDLMDMRISAADPSKIVARVEGTLIPNLDGDIDGVSFLTADGARAAGHHLIELACMIDPPDPTSLGAPPRIKRLVAKPAIGGKENGIGEIFLQDGTGAVEFCTARQARAAAAVLIAAAEEVEANDSLANLSRAKINRRREPRRPTFEIDTSELKASLAKVYAALDDTEPSEEPVDLCKAISDDPSGTIGDQRWRLNNLYQTTHVHCGACGAAGDDPCFCDDNRTTEEIKRAYER